MASIAPQATSSRLRPSTESRAPIIAPRVDRAGAQHAHEPQRRLGAFEIAAEPEQIVGRPARQVAEQAGEHYLEGGGEEEVTRSIDLPSDADSPVNIPELLDRIDNDRKLLAELVDLFRAELPGNLLAAQQAIDQQDSGALQTTAHALRGALGNLSANRALAFCAELETIAKSLKLGEAQGTLERLMRELSNVSRALDALWRCTSIGPENFPLARRELPGDVGSEL